MTDWRKIEDVLVGFFQREGFHPEKPLGQLTPHVGEWIVRPGNNPINLSALARELAQASD